MGWRVTSHLHKLRQHAAAFQRCSGAAAGENSSTAALVKVRRCRVQHQNRNTAGLGMWAG